MLGSEQDTGNHGRYPWKSCFAESGNRFLVFSNDSSGVQSFILSIPLYPSRIAPFFLFSLLLSRYLPDLSYHLIQSLTLSCFSAPRLYLKHSSYLSTPSTQLSGSSLPQAPPFEIWIPLPPFDPDNQSIYYTYAFKSFQINHSLSQAHYQHQAINKDVIFYPRPQRLCKSNHHHHYSSAETEPDGKETDSMK
jgi:hypothetical protein